jgi:hypothetical protein
MSPIEAGNACLFVWSNNPKRLRADLLTIKNQSL